MSEAGESRTLSPDRFEAVVIGSGFGGSVTAFRLAEAGKRVCVLERGKSYAPGSFARTPREMRGNFWRPSRRAYGLFDVWSFRHITSVVSSGLGGGSLIYANVLIRKDENWFVTECKGGGYERWPVSRADLNPHYDAVEKMLKPHVFPQKYAIGNKTSAMREAAQRLRIAETPYDRGDPRVAQWYLPLLAITFQNHGREPEPGQTIVEPRNLHGVPRQTCRLCGECDVGCNYGSKNTLDFNYLTEAKRLGACIRTQSEVETIAPVLECGKLVYHLTYVEHDPETGDKTPRMVIADRVIVACGALGSTLLLLRNRKRLRGLSPMLGKRFSGNGDYLAFAVRAKPDDPDERLNASRAPVITSTFRFPDTRDGGLDTGRGAYLQDAGYPLVGDYLMELLDPLADLRRLLGFLVKTFWASLGGNRDAEISGQLAALFGSADLSSKSMPLLGMGRDTPDGVMSLDWRKRLQVSWKDTRSQPYFGRVDREARAVAGALGATYDQNPLTAYFNRLITVHPLGGAPMGNDASSGVVNSYGEVFGQPGLYVVDGSVMPGPAGPNPSFTIAALADRFATHMLKRWT